MKTSKHILISFFVFIFGAILVLYADAKAHGKEKRAYTVFSQPKKLDSYSVIVAEYNSKVFIKSDSVNTIVIEADKRVSVDPLKKDKTIVEEFKKEFQFPEYKIINDTLYISKEINTSDKIILKTNTLKKIITQKNAKIIILDFKADSLSVSLNNSSLSGDFSSKSLGYFNVIATNKSDINIQNMNISSSLTIKADNSKIALYTNITKELNAVLTNNAELQTGKSEKLQIESDTSSNYFITQYRFTVHKPKATTNM